jgi:hypothetical protein
VASNLYLPHNVVNIFDNCFQGIEHKDRIITRLKAVTLLLSLWLCKNSIVFNAIKSSSLQLIFQLTSAVVYSSQTGTPFVMYGDVLVTRTGGKEYFHPTLMVVA